LQARFKLSQFFERAREVDHKHTTLVLVGDKLHL
jgi:hypothetical protein